MNRQSSFQELLVQREDAIRFLEGRLDTSSTGKLNTTVNRCDKKKDFLKKKKFFNKEL